MTVREMHIEVNQSSQQLGANTRRKLQTPEVDWILNKQQDRLIEMCCTRMLPASKGFEHDQMGIDKIRDLLVTKVMPAYKLDASTCYAPLPPLYAHMISDDSQVLHLCNDPVPDTVSTTYAIQKIKFPQTIKSSSPYYTEVIIKQGMTELYKLTTAVAAIAENPWTGLSSKAEVFVIRNLVLQQLKDLNIDAYWERYDMNYFSGTLIIVSPNTYTITIDGTDLQTSSQTITRSTYSGTGQWRNNRLYSSDKSSNLLDTAFSGTYYYSPVSEIVDQRLLVYMDSSFIVNNCKATYIRKPKKISLILGQDCELTTEGVQQQICDLAVEYIQKITADPNWQIKLQDNIQRTTI